ncbi:uncharacterized protein BX663DRAFT_478561 [Cokeromyces recurvatus]|uniref:uncharacterized protein n=1 Tax=Cokeromyces recurvatus TaxID=90255 RepID=UPI002220F65B|nr:uncharacterized protein BX663DRAFT_478561 [Cokeromyces recurvatus]KAI7899350.1 hypothetical protein BX663DRAFT_478561 [Cokeromyces recurvatus]
MPPQEPTFHPSDLLKSEHNESLDFVKNDYIQGSRKKSNHHIEYTRDELLSYSKCFTSITENKNSFLLSITTLPSILIRYGVLFPFRLMTLTASTIAFFLSLPIGVVLKNNDFVSLCVKYYCKGILFSLGVKVDYIGKKAELKEPHVFVANHTSYLDYILLGANKFPHAVVMARHSGVLGFLQNNGLNYLHSLTFDRSNITERKILSESLKKHVHLSNTWKNPMIIFPEGTCVNNKYIIRFQKGAFELGAKVCPIGIKYDRYFGDPYWDTRKGFMSYAYYRMTRWITPVKVVYCQPQSPQENEDAVDFSNRVKDIIATKIGLEKVDFNGTAKRELLRVLKEVS